MIIHGKSHLKSRWICQICCIADDVAVYLISLECCWTWTQPEKFSNMFHIEFERSPGNVVSVFSIGVVILLGFCRDAVGIILAI